MVGKNVKIFTEVGDGAGDVKSAWIDGTVVAETTVQMGMKAHDNQAGIVVNAPESCYKDKNILVANDLINAVIR